MNTNSYNNNASTMADPAIVKELCLNIKQMRLYRNMSQEELARRAGLNRITISRLEAGRAATLLTLVQILRALDKLELLNIFREEPEISPMQLLKQQKLSRKKATPKKQIMQ